jgi:hypothetical protein
LGAHSAIKLLAVDLKGVLYGTEWKRASFGHH